MRFVKSMAALLLVVVAAEFWNSLETKHAIAIMVVILVVCAELWVRTGEREYRRLVYASGLMVIGLLFLDGRSLNMYIESMRPADGGSESRPDVSTTLDRRDGTLTVTFHGDARRQKRADEARLRQENPELWRKRLQERKKRLEAEAEAAK